MQERIYLIIAILIALPIIAAEKYSHRISYINLRYSKNSFGDIIPDLSSIPNQHLDSDLTAILSQFVTELKDKNPKKAFKIELPWKDSGIAHRIIAAGFTVHFAGNQSVELIYKNGSPIHEPQTALLGAHVAILGDDDTVLIEEEITRPGRVDLPCGAVERGEFIFHAAAREGSEELGLKIDAEKLRLIALLNRKKYNKRYATDLINSYYAVGQDGVSGELAIDKNEVVRALYVPLYKLAKEPEVEGLKISPLHALLAQHLLDQQTIARREILLDERQWFKPEDQQDPEDTMVLELFAR